jgi:hypothetical protein
MALRSRLMTLSLCVECSYCPPFEVSHYAQVGHDDLEDMSPSDEYVHVMPPEEELPEADLKRQEHLIALRQQAPTPPSLPLNTTANL